MRIYKIGTTKILLATAIVCVAVFYPFNYEPVAEQASTDDKTAQNALQEERLNAIKADIAKKVEEYSKLKQEIEELKKFFDQKDSESFQRVIKIYEAMPPEEAARRIEKLDTDTAVSILSALKPKTASKILAQIEAEQAAALSKKILTNVKNLKEKTSR